MKLRAFSVRQPWASLLIAGAKRYEVRSWSPQSMGLLLVHASSSKAVGIRQLRQEAMFQKALLKASIADEDSWVQSAVLGVVEVVKVWSAGAPPSRLSAMDEYLCGTTQNVFLWQIGRRWLFQRPVPCHGALGLWTPASAARRRITAEIRNLNVPVETAE